MQQHNQHWNQQQQLFSSRLSDLYPQPNDEFFSHPPQQQQQQQEQQQQRGGSPKRAISKKDEVEEHKYPEQSSQQQQQQLQPRSQPTDLVDHRISSSPFDLWGDMNHAFDAQMARMNRMMQHFGGGGVPLDRDLGSMSADFSPKDGSYSFHSSSSSYSAGPDASSKPFYRHVAHSSQCVDGVSESRARYEDSFGNRREQSGWGLGNQHREVLMDRNAKGEERSTENLRELEPEKVEEFTRQWDARRAQVDPKNRLLGATRTQQQQPAAIKSGEQQVPIRSIKSNEQNSGRKQMTA